MGTTQPINYFFGRSDFESIIKTKLKEDGNYCLRYHGDKGGIEVCCYRVANCGPHWKKEKIERKVVKNKGVMWRWDESVAQTSGKKIVTQYFKNIGDFIKHLKKKWRIGEAVLHDSVYMHTMLEGKSESQDALKKQIMNTISEE